MNSDRLLIPILLLVASTGCVSPPTGTTSSAGGGSDAKRPAARSPASPAAPLPVPVEEAEPTPVAEAWIDTPLPAPPERVVPMVRGQEWTVARQLIRLAELQGGTGTFYIAPASWRDDVDRRAVQIQTPQPGSRVPPGETVACWLFRPAGDGLPIVTLPDLRGLTWRAAAGRIEELALEVMDLPPDSLDNGETLSGGTVVVDHYPRPHQAVYQGTSIYLQMGR